VWQRTIEAVHENGQRQQLRLFTDREGQVPVVAEDVAEVIRDLSAANHTARTGSGDAPVSDGLVAARTAAATKLQGSGLRCVADLTGRSPSFFGNSIFP